MWQWNQLLQPIYLFNWPRLVIVSCTFNDLSKQVGSGAYTGLMNKSDRWLRSLKFISAANCKVAESCANHVIGLFCLVQEPTESWLSHPSSKYAFKMYYFFIVALFFKMLKVLLARPPPPGPGMCSLSSSSPLNCQFLCKECIYRKIKSKNGWLLSDQLTPDHK